MLIKGGCHCGNISFDFRVEPEPQELQARECGCSFCTMHRGVWTSAPGGSLRVRIADKSQESIYAFGTRTAEFHICALCGVVPFVTCELEGQLYAVVNVNTFNGVDPGLLTHSPANFDGEEKDARLARRQRSWISDVEISES